MDEFQNFLGNLDPDEPQDETIYAYLRRNSLNLDLILFTKEGKSLAQQLFEEPRFDEKGLLKSSAAAYFMRLAWGALKRDSKDDLKIEIETDIDRFLDYRTDQIEIDPKSANKSMIAYFEKLVPQKLRDRLDQKGHTERLYPLLRNDYFDWSR